MKKFLFLLGLILTSALLGGCYSAENVSGYKRPYDFGSKKVRKHNYGSINFRSAYDSFIKETNYAMARIERDQILYELMAIIEAEHGEYERSMIFRKSTADMVFDFLELGLSGAGAVTGGAETKAILAAIATGTKGAEISVNRRVFHDQAVEAIQAQMRAAQKSRKAQIIESIQKTNVVEYPLDLGLSDVVEFYYDGTLARAFQSMVRDAKKKEEAAEMDINDALGRLTPTANLAPDRTSRTNRSSRAGPPR
jgi:hypothetical protein